jgi:hypothetical protein
VEQTLVLESLQSRMNGSRSDLTVQALLNDFEDGPTVCLVPESQDRQQDSLFKCAKDTSHDTYIVGFGKPVSIWEHRRSVHGSFTLIASLCASPPAVPGRSQPCLPPPAAVSLPRPPRRALRGNLRMRPSTWRLSSNAR